MQTFISETLEDILKTTTTFKDVVFVVPSQRAGVFLKKQLQQKIGIGFLPQILSIEFFIEKISDFQKLDSIPLLYHFYSVYKKHTPLEKTDSFSVFISWAYVVLQDFNEIDQNLVDANSIFTYLKDIDRLKKWAPNKQIKETELLKNSSNFMQHLSVYYQKFYAYLVNRKIGYQGLLYREAIKNIDDYIRKNKSVTHFILGFNALNKAEEMIFQKIITELNSDIFWDIDSAFLESNHLAGSFIRKYQKTWKYYSKNKLKHVGNWFVDAKNIQVIGASKNVTQIKYVGEILQQQSQEQTALVLADETLLPVALNSLPKNIKSANVTMGYPLQNIPTAKLFDAVFQLFLTQQKLQKTTENLFYYKDVIRFLKEPALKHLFVSNTNSIEKLHIEIADKNQMFVSGKFIYSFFNTKEHNVKESLKNIFSPFSNGIDFINRILNLILDIKEKTNTLEQEYLYRFYTIFKQLENLEKKFHFLSELKTVQHLFQQLIRKEKLAFKGEPLQGLQIMGMLETRALDFENIIITSANEGVLPKNSTAFSFIPFDAKIEYNLPTYKERDAIFSYHFFRLLQRAKNIYVLYNTETDTYGSGEKSRFVMQLQLLKNTTDKIIHAKLNTRQKELQEIPKTKNIEQKLLELAKKGISPSALTSYLYNPIEFYKQKILGLYEHNEVEETVEANTMGTVIHNTLEDLYKPVIGNFLTEKDVEEMQKKSEIVLEKNFRKELKEGNFKTGKNYLILAVSKQYIYRFLEQEKEIITQNKSLKIIDIESNLSTEINVDGIPFPIKIHGKVDRIDELNGITRIIDYKTGKVDEIDLKVADFESLIKDYKHHKAIQVLLYCYLYEKSNLKKTNHLEAGVISFKNLNRGFLKLNFSKKRSVSDSIVTTEKLAIFISVIKKLIAEIYDSKKTFKEPLELPF